MSLPLRWEEPSSPESPSTPSHSPLRRRRRSPAQRMLGSTLLFTLILSIGTLTAIGAQSVWAKVHADASLQLDARPDGQQVTSSYPAIERRLGFVTVTGNIVSHDPQPLHQVEAVVELLNAQHETIEVESGMIGFDPLMPGQTAPYRVDLPDNVHAAAYRIRFKQLSGATLN